MARYIDAELLMQKLSRMIDFCEKHKVSGLNALFQVGDAIMDCPTADVVPNSEVDKIENAYNRAIRKVNKNAITAIQKAKQEFAREIFEEIGQIKKEYASGDIDGNELYVRLYLLEKKYTEDNG